MKQLRSLFYLLVFVVVAVLFVWGANTFYNAPGVAIQPMDRAFMLILPGIVVLLFLFGWAERFILRNGLLMGALGSFILVFHESSPIGRSLTNLKRWYALYGNGALSVPLEGDVNPADYPPGLLEYVKGLSPQERAEFVSKSPFSQWMVADIVKRYENNVNGFAYLGAGILIFLIGLRGLGIIGREHPLPIVISLEIEFTIIGVLGLLLFYKPEESTKMSVKIEGALPAEELRTVAAELGAVRQAMTSERTITMHIGPKKP